MSIRLPTISLADTSGFIPVEAKRKGYRYEKNHQQITLKRVDRWATMAGLPPLYYFRGDLMSVADGLVLNGRLLMTPLSKCFILVWLTIVAVAFLGILLWATLLAGQFMISPSPAIEERLMAAGFMIGGILGLGLFGSLIIAMMRVISRPQRQKLISFLQRAQDSGLTASMTTSSNSVT